MSHIKKGFFMSQESHNLNSQLKESLFSVFLIAIVLITIMLLVAGLSFAQVKPRSERWIQGHMTAINKDSISVEGTKYMFDLLVSVTNLSGDTLNINELRNAEIVKVLVKDGKAMKIIVIQLRE